MDHPIWKRIDFSVDEQKMFDELVKRREKLRTTERMMVMYAAFFQASALYALVVIGYFLMWEKQSSISFFVSDIGNSALIAIGIALFSNIQWSIQNKKKKERKDKYNTLRKEAVDKINKELKKKYQEPTMMALIEELGASKINVSYKG